MAFIKRIFLFVLTNFAILVIFGIIIGIVNMLFPQYNISAYGDMGGLLIYCAIIGFLGSFLSLAISKFVAKRVYPMKMLTQEGVLSQDENIQTVWNSVARIASENNIRMPEVGIYTSDEPNAFATGPSKNRALVAVSTGLLKNMNAREVEGVIGHEMAHVMNGDMVTMTLVQGVLNTFVYFLSFIVARIVVSFFQNDRGNDSAALGGWAYTLISWLFQFIFGILASLVVMWFGRQREYRADIGGAKYMGKDAMLSALRRLKEMSGVSRHATQKETNQVSAFMISAPDSVFSTHPSIDNRIARLEENYSLA